MSAAEPVPADSAAAEQSTAGVPVWLFVVAVIVIGTFAHAALHHREHGVWNVPQIGVAFFLVLNVLINFWELSLWACADKVDREYQAMKGPFKGKELERVNAFFASRIPALSLLSFARWTGVWSTYALFDKGYADRGSFGYNIDVANGVTTLIPATLFAFGMTYEIVPARVLGIIGVAMFWQMLFGTIVYFFQFFNAGRHVGHTFKNLVMFVGFTNGMWFVFPVWGIWLSVQMIYLDDFSVFL